MKLLRFEFKKSFRTKWLPYFFLLTAIFIVAIFFRNIAQQDLIPLKKVEYFLDFSMDVARQNHSDQMSLEEEPNPQLQEKLAIGQTLHQKLGELMKSIEEGEKESELRVENEVYTQAMTYQELEGQFALSQTEMQDMIQLNEQLLALNLTKEDEDLSVQQAVFMKKISTLLLSPIGFIIYLLVMGSMVTREFEERNIQLVYTFPIPKWRYVLTKFSSLMAAGLAWLALIIILSYVLPLMLEQPEVTVFQYPLLLNTGQLIEIGTYLMKVYLLAASFLLFAIALLVSLGFIFRSTIITYLVIFILFIIGWMISSSGVLHVANPFSYQEIHSVLMAYPFQLLPGYIVLIVSATALLLLTVMVTRKRGI